MMICCLSYPGVAADVETDEGGALLPGSSRVSPDDVVRNECRPLLGGVELVVIDEVAEPGGPRVK